MNERCFVEQVSKYLDYTTYDVVSIEFKRLIDNAVDCEFKGNSVFLNRRTVLTMLSEKGFFNHLSFYFNSKINFDVNQLDGTGRSAICVANNVDCLDLLLQHADVRVRIEGEKYLPLHKFTLNDNYECMEKLLHANVDVNAKNVRGSTALHSAKSAKAVWLLVNSGGFVDERDENGQTPLMVALQRGRSKATIFALIDAGADVNAIDHYGIDVLSHVPSKAQQLVDNAEIMMALTIAGASIVREGDSKSSARTLRHLINDQFKLRVVVVCNPHCLTIELVSTQFDQTSSHSLLLFRKAVLPLIVACDDVSEVSCGSEQQRAEIEAIVADQKQIDQELKEHQQLKERWHRMIWQRCRRRVVQLAEAFVRLPTLIVIEICFAEQPLLRLIEYHLLNDLVERIKKVCSNLGEF